MIQKTELLMTLSTLLDIEERGTALVIGAVGEELPEADLPEAEREWLLKEVLGTIRRESEGHTRKVKELIDRVKGDDRYAL